MIALGVPAVEQSAKQKDPTRGSVGSFLRPAVGASAGRDDRLLNRMPRCRSTQKPSTSPKPTRRFSHGSPTLPSSLCCSWPCSDAFRLRHPACDSFDADQTRTFGKIPGVGRSADSRRLGIRPALPHVRCDDDLLLRVPRRRFPRSALRRACLFVAFCGAIDGLSRGHGPFDGLIGRRTRTRRDQAGLLGRKRDTQDRSRIYERIGQKRGRGHGFPPPDAGAVQRPWGGENSG